MEPVKIPMSQVELTIPIDSLLRLPFGAMYIATKDRLTIKVRNEKQSDNGIIHISAECDSLVVQCEQYERIVKTKNTQIATIQKQLNEEKENHLNVILKLFKWFLIGIAVGVIITKLLPILKKL